MENVMIFNPVFCTHVYKQGAKKGQICGRYCRKIREDSKCGEHKPRHFIKCPHNRQKSKCKECGGSSICEHNRIKSSCKDCNFKGYISSILLSRITIALNRYEECGGLNRLGCDIDQFIEYINNKLDNQEIPDGREKMTWENYAITWQFDHIIPIFKGNFKNLTIQTVLDRLHYENIQPLYIDLNMKKGNRC